MGKIDSMAKDYFRDPVRFAATFNYLMYGGDPVINPNDLTPLDSTEVKVVANDSPVQKYRDLLNQWGVMEDGHMVYVLLGAELQAHVHYAMPVKDMLYDAINYATQVSIAGRKYKRKKESEILIDEDGVRIKLSKDEFLSGFRKDDKLKPIVTAVVYLGIGEWDAPMSLHDMFDLPDERANAFIPDYKINLVYPKDMEEADFDRMGENDLGFLMKVLKLGSDGFGDMFSEERYKTVNPESAILANEIANLGLKIEVTEKGDVDMCQAMERMRVDSEIIGSVKTLRKLKWTDESIRKSIMEDYNLTEEEAEVYVPKTVPA